MEIEEAANQNYEEEVSAYCESSIFPNPPESNQNTCFSNQFGFGMNENSQSQMGFCVQNQENSNFWNYGTNPKRGFTNAGMNQTGFGLNSAPFPHPNIGSGFCEEETKKNQMPPAYQPTAFQQFQPAQGVLKFVDPNSGMRMPHQTSSPGKTSERDSDDEYDPTGNQPNDESSEEGELAPLEPEEPSNTLLLCSMCMF